MIIRRRRSREMLPEKSTAGMPDSTLVIFPALPSFTLKPYAVFEARCLKRRFSPLS
jgi:hypothetical protein